jgi:hypothetical protein
MSKDVLVEVDRELYEWALKYHFNDTDTFSDLIRRLIAHQDRDLMKPEPVAPIKVDKPDHTDELAGDAPAIMSTSRHKNPLAAGRAIRPRKGEQ